MAILEIIKDDNKLLRQVSKPVDDVTQAEVKLLEDMYETLKNNEGLGIVAPQVGVLKRIILVEWEDNIYKVINPEIIEKSGRQIYIEGCISIYGKDGDFLYGEVERSYKIKVSGLDEKGNKIIIDAESVLAVIFEHEIDHLDGILYIDKVIGELLHFKTKEERKEYKENVFVHRILER